MSEWRAAVGFEGRYEVSDDGYVRSLIGPRGKRREKPKILKGHVLPPPVPIPGHHGYMQMHLRRDGGDVMKLLHVLVLEAFRGPCPDGHESSHLDGNSLNNALGNLAWETRSMNHVRRRVPVGADARRAKLTAEQVVEMREARAAGESTRVLAKRYEVTTGAIYAILSGKTWKKLGGYREKLPAGRP